MSAKKPKAKGAAAAEQFYGEFSPCGQFRYLLVHIWDASKPVLPWILFNPSQAGRVTEQGIVKSDPTARKGRGFSERMGYGGMVFCNAFAYIATDPKDLRKGGYQVGPDNDSKILQACAMGTGDVMVAWGALGRGLARPQEVSRMVRKAGYRTLALGRTDDGLPLHPLRLAYATPVEVFLG